MNADCAFFIGKTHSVCEDYARAQDDCVVLGDGCSSSVDSDIGARLLCSAVCSLIDDFPQQNNGFYGYTLFRADTVRKIMELKKGCLDATLLVANYDSLRRGVFVSTIGDGIRIARLRENGRFLVWARIYPDEYPYYLNYSSDEDRLDDYIKQGHGKCNVLHLVIDLADGVIDSSVEENVSDWETHKAFFDQHLYDLVLIASDGLSHFYKSVETSTSRYGENIGLSDVLVRLLAFKNFTKKFVYRRLFRFLSDCEKDGWYGSDDISLGAIYLGD